MRIALLLRIAPLLPLLLTPTTGLAPCAGLPLGRLELAPVCLATAADRARFFSVLPRLSRSWPGSMSASVLTRELLDAEERAFSLAALVDAGACAPERIAITLVDGARFTAPPRTLFPHNLLRNLALRACEDPYVLMLDADFELMPPLSARVLRETTSHWLAPDSGRRLAIVLPSFQIRKFLLARWLRHDVHDAPFAHKAGLRELFVAGAASPFNAHIYVPGERATNYTRWLSAQDNESYPVPFEDGWEPYLLLRRDVAVEIPYDGVFVGYGLNKISHVEELHAAGTAFRVSSELYVVHTHTHLTWGQKGGGTRRVQARPTQTHAPAARSSAPDPEPGTCIVPQLSPWPDDTGASCMHLFYCRLKRQYGYFVRAVLLPLACTPASACVRESDAPLLSLPSPNPSNCLPQVVRQQLRRILRKRCKHATTCLGGCITHRRPELQSLPSTTARRAGAAAWLRRLASRAGGSDTASATAGRKAPEVDVRDDSCDNCSSAFGFY